MSFAKSASHRAPRKYPHGEPKTIESYPDLLTAIERRRYFFIGMNKRPHHWAWVGNMPFCQIARLIKSHSIRCAVRNPDVPYVFDVYLHDGEVKGAWGKCDELPGGIITAKTEQGLRRSCRSKLHSFCYDVPLETIKIEFRIHSK